MSVLLGVMVMGQVVGGGGGAGVGGGGGGGGGVVGGLPWWVVVPLTAVVMLTIAAHVQAVQGSEMPASRRRIRLANGLLMLVTTPMLAFAVTVSHRGSPRAFAAAWVLVMALLAMIVFLALLDIANTVRLNARERAALGREAAEALARDTARARAERGGAGTSGGMGEGAGAGGRDG